MANELDSSNEADYRRGVGIMLLSSRGQVLIARRRDIGGNAWQMPQGGIEPGESPRIAALRELREEIGTDAAEIIAESKGWLRYEFPSDLMGKVRHGRWRGQRQKWFAMRFTGTDADIKLDTANPEFDAWKWASIMDIPHLIVSFKRQVYLNLLTEFSQFLEQDLDTLLADPIIRLMLAADSVDENELYSMLRRVAEMLQNRSS